MISSGATTQDAASQQAGFVTVGMTAAIVPTNRIAVNALSFISIVDSLWRFIIVHFRLFSHKFMSIHPHVTATLIDLMWFGCGKLILSQNPKQSSSPDQSRDGTNLSWFLLIWYSPMANMNERLQEEEGQETKEQDQIEREIRKDEEEKHTKLLVF